MNGMLLEDVSLVKESVEMIPKLPSTPFEFHRTGKILVLNPRQGDPLGEKNYFTHWKLNIMHVVEFFLPPLC